MTSSVDDGAGKKETNVRDNSSCLKCTPYFHLCAVRPGSGNAAKLLWALEMWQLSRVNDVQYSEIFPYRHGNASDFWPVFEYNLHVGQRPWDLFFFPLVLHIHVVQIRIGGNKMWHHAGFLLFTLIRHYQIGVTHEGENMSWDNFSRSATVVDLDGGRWQRLVLSQAVSHLRHMLGGFKCCCSASLNNLGLLLCYC